MYVTVLAIIIVTIWMILKWTKWGKLDHIPGPKGFPVVGNALHLGGKPRLTFHNWQQTYGDVYRVRLPPFGDVVVVAGFESMYEVLVTKGHQFSDRPNFFRKEFFYNTGSVLNSPDSTWRFLKKTTLKHMKLLGDKRVKAEEMIKSITDELMDVFAKEAGKPFNPTIDIRLAALATIAFFIMGERLPFSDKLLHTLEKCDRDANELFSSASVDGLIMDMFPWLIHVPMGFGKKLHALKHTHASCWDDIRSHQAADPKGLVKLFLDGVHPSVRDVKGSGLLYSNFPEEGDDQNMSEYIKMRDAGISTIVLLSAGLITTSPAFTYLLGALAENPDIQERILSEANAVPDPKGMDSSHQIEMPFTHAVIFEVLRIFPPAPLGVLHAALEETSITGYGTIPKGTIVMNSIWSLHHNKAFWGDPGVFRPGRFLDVSGALLPADHPVRTHFMPFSAGPRVCTGETFALTRLRMWTIALVQRFHIQPACGNIPNWLDPCVHPEDLTMVPLPYNVIFTTRE